MTRLIQSDDTHSLLWQGFTNLINKEEKTDEDERLLPVLEWRLEDNSMRMYDQANMEHIHVQTK